MKAWATVISAASIAGLLISPVARAQGGHDTDLAAARDRLLLTYSTFKGYGLSNPQDVYMQKLTPDRRALFDAMTRAMFVELETAKGPTGTRVITLVEQVLGIWGMRLGEKEGRRMFRLSVRFAAGARKALEASSNIPKSLSGHVLMPVASGGDDSPTFNQFDIKGGSAVVTFRQAGPRPNLQLSMLSSDERVGESDLDFDAGCGPWPIRDCHCKPSNSDVGSLAQTDKDNHLVMFNARVPLFANPLATTWSNTAAHCKATY